MPRFYKQNVLSKAKTDPEELLPSPLDTPELPAAEDEDYPESPEHSEELDPEPEHEKHHEHQYEDHEPVQTLITWVAPSRPYRKKDRSFYTYATVLVILVSIIAFLFGYALLIGALFALLFLVYVLNFTPPEDLEYKISTQGITIKDHFYHWYELDSFWLEEKEGFKMVHVVTEIRFPTKLILVLGAVDENEIKNIIARYLPFHEIAPKSLVEKWGESLQKHFPLENPHS